MNTELQSGGLFGIVSGIKHSMIKSRIIKVAAVEMDDKEVTILSVIIDTIRLDKILHIIKRFQGKTVKQIQQILIGNPKMIIDILRAVEINKLASVIKKIPIKDVTDVISEFLHTNGINIKIPIDSFKRIMTLLERLSINNSPIVNIQLFNEIRKLFEDSIFSIQELRNKSVPQLRKVAKHYGIKIKGKMSKIDLIAVISEYLF